MIRSLITLTTLSVLVFTSIAAGVARGQADPVGQIVICTGATVAMIHVDANGDPTGPPVLCPDGVMSLLAAVTALPPELPPTLSQSDLRPPVPLILAKHPVPTDRKARSPPQAS